MLKLIQKLLICNLINIVLMIFIMVNICNFYMNILINGINCVVEKKVTKFIWGVLVVKN